MAHEVKNGLQAVHTFVDQLLEKKSGRELGGIVRKELDRVNAILTKSCDRLAGPASFRRCTAMICWSIR